MSDQPDLTDPVVVHINMLRGTIGKLTWAQVQHLYPEQFEHIERQQQALQRIAAWADAYPTDIFPEPDWPRAREALKAAGISLDAVSAACMRHVVEVVGKIAREVLSSENSAPHD